MSDDDTASDPESRIEQLDGQRVDFETFAGEPWHGATLIDATGELVAVGRDQHGWIAFQRVTLDPETGEPIPADDGPHPAVPPNRVDDVIDALREGGR